MPIRVMVRTGTARLRVSNFSMPSCSSCERRHRVVAFDEARTEKDEKLCFPVSERETHYTIKDYNGGVKHLWLVFLVLTYLEKNA